MRKFYGLLAATCLSLLTISNVSAQQSSYQKIYTILNANCTASGCHNTADHSANLDFTLPASTVYNNIVNKVPANPVAASHGNYLIDPGYPARSFILRKIANCSDADLALELNEGERMPNEGNGNPPLPDSTMELVRQWIYFGAPETGAVVDTTLIAMYYGGPHVPRVTPPSPPPPCQGYQIHMGPIFFYPNGQANSQLEYFLRYDLHNTDSVEVKGLDLDMSAQSHHFIIRKYAPGTAETDGMATQGLILLTPFIFQDLNMEYVMAWQTNLNVDLPNGTAYRWEPNASIDLDYHVNNPDSLPLGADVYINVLTQPAGTSQIEMKSSLINNLNLDIKAHDTTTVKMNVAPGNGTYPSTDISIWSITPHTHKFGIGYNVWLEGPGGSTGDQIFNGDENFYYTFNQGFYSWDHPPTRFIAPMLYLNDPQSDGSAVTGLVEQATWYNYSDTTVHFGFTTQDEMMIFYIQYVDGAYTIPEQGYVNPSCPALIPANPCNVPAVSDTNQMGGNDFIIGKGGDTTSLSGSKKATVSLGDTITIFTNDSSYTFVVTGNYDSIGPFQIGNGDVIISSDSSGNVYLNGTLIGVETGKKAITVAGINNVQASSYFNVFPNPFEGHTNIQYSLTDNNAVVTLDVFDLLGRKIGVLADNESQSAGAHSYNYTPGGTGSGIYFIKLTINGVTTVKKITVL